MSTPIKISIFIISTLVFLALALIALVKTQITPEKVRETLLPLAEKSLQRSVDFGEIKIGLFSGISIADLQVMQKNGKDEFFSVHTVALHYQFWPLFTGKVIVDQILLDQPKINFIRRPDGHFNFCDLLHEPTTGGNGSAVSGQHDRSTALPATFNLLVKEVNIKAGELLYVDKFKNAKSPFRYSLNNLNFKARQITFDQSFPVDLSAVINGANIDVSGRYNFSNRTGDLTILLAPLGVVQFAPYYRDVFPGKLGAAQLSLNLKVAIQPDLVSSKGKITFADVDLVLDMFPDTGLKKASLGIDYALNYNVEKQLLAVSTLLFNFNGINLGAEGEVDLSTPDPYLVSRLFLKKLDLREVMQNLPVELSRNYQKYSFAGMVDGRVDFSGELSRGIDLLKSAQLSLTDVRANSEHLRAGISGDITYADKVLQLENLLLQYGDQQAQLQAKVERAPDNIFHGEFDLSADTLDLNKILSKPAPEIRSEPEPVGSNTGNKGIAVPAETEQKTLADDIGPFDIPINMQGTLAIKRLIYQKLNVDKVTADLSLKNNSLSITDLTGQIGDGELEGSALVDLGIKGLSYRGEMSLRQPNVMTLISGLFPDTEQSATGQLQWQNNFSGSGTLADNWLPALQLKGEINLQQGSVKGFPALEQLAGFLDSPTLKVISFQSLTGQYDLRDGLARIKGQLNSSKTKLISTGTVAIDGHLNLNLDARFSPEVLGKLGLNKVLKKTVADQDGWGTLPLLIRGTLDHPQVSYNSVALQDQVIEKASQKLLEKLVPEGDGTAEPLKKMLDNTLNKLFGK